MVISTFGLNWFDNDTGNKFPYFVETFKLLFNLCQTFTIFGLVLFDVLLKWVLVTWEAGNRPIQSGNINLVNSL